MDRGDRGDRPMYDATCSDCGQTCQVPFNQRKEDRYTAELVTQNTGPHEDSK